MPTLLQPRLGPLPRGLSPVPTTNQWLDDLTARVQAHIADMQVRTDVLAAQARSPAALFAGLEGQPELVKLGARLNQTYTAALRQRVPGYGTLPTLEDYDAARVAAEAYLRRFPPDMQTQVVRGALYSVYTNPKPVSDAVCWLPGAKTPDGRAPGIADVTLRALRQCGLLSRPV